MKPSLFVVEDDPDISRLVRHHLENEGFVVRVYPTGASINRFPIPFVDLRVLSG